MNHNLHHRHVLQPYPLGEVYILCRLFLPESDIQLHSIHCLNRRVNDVPDLRAQHFERLRIRVGHGGVWGGLIRCERRRSHPAVRDRQARTRKKQPADQEQYPGADAVTIFHMYSYSVVRTGKGGNSTCHSLLFLLACLMMPQIIPRRRRILRRRRSEARS